MSASGSNLKLSFVEETTWGETPATPQMKVLAGVTAESIGGTQEALVSNALNPNRGVDFMAAGQITAGGSIEYELGVFGAVSLIAAAMGDIVTTGAGPYTHEITVSSGPKFLTIEKWHTDIEVGFVFKGCKINTFSLNTTPNGIATGSIGLLAKSYLQSSTELDPTPTQLSHAFHDGIRASVEIGGVAYNVLSNLSLEATNNLEDSRAIGSDESAALTPGRFEVSGSFTLPLSVDMALPLIAKAVNGTEDTLKITFTNGASSVEFFLPRIKYSGDPVPKVGGQSLINLELSFTSLLDNNPLSTTYNESIKVTVINDEASLI